MKFDVVIGNPPYNRGIDIDFVNMGYDLSNKYVCMIIPAKWQTAEGKQSIASNLNYAGFREKIVPYIVKVVFYPYCKDVFDIQQVDGITYFVVDKQKVHGSKAIVENRSKRFASLNSIEIRDITHREPLLNIGNELLNYLGHYESYKFSQITYSRKYQVWVNTKPPGGGLSTVESKRRVIIIGKCIIRTRQESLIAIKHKAETKTKETAITPVFESDDINECRSFISWINCKFTQFMRFINQSKMTNNMTNDCFRLVPSPAVLDSQGNKIRGKFDHIYTDKEMFITFNIPQKYINIIEELIKGRDTIE